MKVIHRGQDVISSPDLVLAVRGQKNRGGGRGRERRKRILAKYESKRAPIGSSITDAKAPRVCYFFRSQCQIQQNTTSLIYLKISPENVKQLSVKTSSAKRSSVSVEGSLTVRWSKKYFSAKSSSLFGTMKKSFSKLTV